MPDKDKLSQTMRIDLIPDVPAHPVKGGKKRIVISSPTRKQTQVSSPVEAPAPTAQGESGFGELLQSLYDAAIITDGNGNIVECNVRALEFLQYRWEELQQLAVSDVVSGADATLIQTLSQNLEEQRFTLIQAFCIRSDGSYFPSEIAVSRMQLGSLHLCFFLRDITLRRQAEEMLRTEHNAIQNAGNGIAVANMNAQLEYVNPALAHMWGYDDPEELLGQDVGVLLGEDEEIANMIEAVMDSGQTWIGELGVERELGAEFDVQVSAACNRNSDGEAVGMVFSFVDISDRKRAEQAVREAERHRVMLESLGAACHHLGQPATVLLANLGIIQGRIEGADELVRELISNSIQAAETLGEILHKLNTVNEYKTTQYLEKPDGSDSEENRILDI